MVCLWVLIGLVITSLLGMDMPASPLLIKDIVDTRIAPCMTLREISRLKRTCKEHNRIIDSEFFLQKHPYALGRLFELSYDVRTIILAHYGVAKNNEMFSFLWDKEKELRDDDHVMSSNTMADLPLDYCMQKYGQEYSTRKKIEKIRVKQLSFALWAGSTSVPSRFLKKILPGSGFNIWDIHIASSKKPLSSLSAKRKTKRIRENIIKTVCGLRDADLLLAIMGGIIEPRALRHIFKWSDRSFINDLIAKDAFITNIGDKHGNTFYYYQYLYMTQSSLSYSRGGIR